MKVKDITEKLIVYPTKISALISKKNDDPEVCDEYSLQDMYYSDAIVDESGIIDFLETTGIKDYTVLKYKIDNEAGNNDSSNSIYIAAIIDEGE